MLAFSVRRQGTGWMTAIRCRLILVHSGRHREGQSVRGAVRIPHESFDSINDDGGRDTYGGGRSAGQPSQAPPPLPPPPQCDHHRRARACDGETPTQHIQLQPQQLRPRLPAPRRHMLLRSPVGCRGAKRVPGKVLCDSTSARSIPASGCDRRRADTQIFAANQRLSLSRESRPTPAPSQSTSSAEE
ncbi:uncharacterized protein PSFLO_00722 [Pseudozyma flocculosa]|uniref:Uncharacterized protein n=1 Tax=Pseudozyma flocculosa TaxID=84751 RepID=A0A5C3EVX8_9BASI|nr:uncharacterized protein PSFLO_00722 [Pseudozyma flocculosa]